eukprot:2127502-Amphidinium_carterae.1
MRPLNRATRRWIKGQSYPMLDPPGPPPQKRRLEDGEVPEQLEGEVPEQLQGEVPQQLEGPLFCASELGRTSLTDVVQDPPKGSE